MLTGWGRRLWGVGVPAALVGVLGPAVPQAHAECLDAVVYVTRQGDTPIYLYGETDPCVTETPWDQSVTYHEEFTRTGLPQDTPDGYWIDLQIPAP